MSTRTIFAGLAMGAALLASSAAGAGTIYSNDFESGSTANLTGFTAIETAPNGQKYLGPLAAGANSTLTLNTAGYNSITLAFDLYTLNSLDGQQAPGPDFFKLTANDATLFNQTFTNVVGWTQSYGGNAPGGTGSDPALTGALGYNFYGPDHTYHLSFTLTGPAATTAFTFFGNSDQTWTDEGFGIDNILVTGVTSAVPEPSTWAMMLAGFGGLALMARRRLRRQAAAA